MTREEILESCRSCLNDDEGKSVYYECESLEAMQLYADQQTAPLQARIKELTEALSSLIYLHNCEQEGLSSGQPTPEMWFEAVEKASEVLNKINK